MNVYIFNYVVVNYKTSLIDVNVNIYRVCYVVSVYSCFLGYAHLLRLGSVRNTLVFLLPTGVTEPSCGHDVRDPTCTLVYLSQYL